MNNSRCNWSAPVFSCSLFTCPPRRSGRFYSRKSPGKSIVGIVLSIVSLIVMPLLARAKRRIAARRNSRALRADSRQTDICAYLSAILLGGLLLNALLGWWWADSVAALLMVPVILREAFEAFRGETCDVC